MENPALDRFEESQPRFATIKKNVEALLFASGSPLTVQTLASALSGSEPVAVATIEAALAELELEFPRGGDRGFELVRLAGGWALRTSPSCQVAVSALFELPDDLSRLSPAAVEVLAIIAYLQPASRRQIAEIRGVNSDSPVQKLLERELITEVGRAQSAGSAVLYGTTPRFEAMYGLADLDDLPGLEGFALTEEQKDDLRRRLGLLGAPE